MKLLRFVPGTRGGFYVEGITTPPVKLFQPSTDDINAAAETGSPVRVSVWNLDSTSCTEAHQVQCCLAEGERPKRNAVYIGSADIEEVARKAHERGIHGIKLVDDPLEEGPCSGHPGYDGHRGIEGLKRQKGCSKADMRAILTELASRCLPHCPE